MIKQRIVDFMQELDSVAERCGRGRGDISVIFATKYLNPGQMVSFLKVCKELGMDSVTIGENRVQDAQQKLDYIKRTDEKLLDYIRPILIGNLQTNKINKAIELFDEIHSVDSLDLAKAMDGRLKKQSKKMAIFLEVNVSGEESKHGFKIDEIDNAILTIKQCNNVTIKGLMTMAPYTDNLEEIRGIFRNLRLLADHYLLKTSMGMSNDWKIAVEEGSDLIRIGSRIFS